MVRNIAMLSLLVASSGSAAPAVQQPTSKWVVHFEAAQCVATREYGSEDKPVHFVLKAPPLGDVMQVGVVWNAADRTPVQVTGEVAFNNAPPFDTTMVEFGQKKSGQRALLVNLSSQQVAPMRQASSVRIRAKDAGAEKWGTREAFGLSRVDQSFALGGMNSLLKAMDDCTADLRKVWNVYDEDVPGTLKQGPSGNIDRIFDDTDYPGIAADKNQSGKVELVLLIDETGKVADCTVTRTSGVASLDVQSCAVIKARGKFKPAIGQDGQPAKSSMVQRISYEQIGI